MGRRDAPADPPRRGVRPADHVRQARHRPVGAHARLRRRRGPHGRHPGGDGRGGQRARRGDRPLGRRSARDPVRRDISGAHDRARALEHLRAGWPAPTTRSGSTARRSKEFIEHIASVWGTGAALEPFLGTAIADEERKRAMARYERNAATPKMAAEVLTRNVEIDVRTALPAVERADARAAPPARSGAALPAGPVHRGADSRRAVRRAARRVPHQPRRRRRRRRARPHRGVPHRPPRRAAGRDRPGARDRAVRRHRRVDRSGSRSSAITAGASCSTRSAPRCGASSSATAVARSTRGATTSSRRSTGRRARSRARRRSAQRPGRSASRCAPGCTPARSSCRATTSRASRCTSVRGSRRSPARARCS